MQPDLTDFRSLLAASLTPRISGELRVETAADRTTRLVFDGRTQRRSRLTIPLERFLIGDPLLQSGVDTLLDIIADRMATAPLDPPHAGPTQGPVQLPVPR